MNTQSIIFTENYYLVAKCTKTGKISNLSSEGVGKRFARKQQVFLYRWDLQDTIETVQAYLKSGNIDEKYTAGYMVHNLTEDTWEFVEVKAAEVVVETPAVEEVVEIANEVVETVEVMNEIVVKTVKSEYLISDMGNYERVKSINKVDRRDNVKEKDIEYATAWEIIEMIEEMHLESLSREIRQEVENSNSHDEALKIKIELAEAKKKITADKITETRRLKELAKSQPINKIIKLNI